MPVLRVPCLREFSRLIEGGFLTGCDMFATIEQITGDMLTYESNKLCISMKTKHRVRILTGSQYENPN